MLLIPLLLRGQPSTNLWLELPTVTNGTVPLILHNVQSNKLYEIMSTIDLTAASWKPEVTLETISNEDQIFTALKASPETPALFFRAMESNFVSAYLTDGLVEWNKFNDADGTVAADASGNGNTMTLVGSPNWGPGYLTLDGSTQYGDAGTNQLSFLDLHDLTICAWIKKVSPSFKGLVDKTFSVPGVGYGGWGFRVLENNRLDWWVQDNQDLVDLGPATVALGEWTFVAVAWHYTAQKADFYIDGILSSTVGNGAANQHPGGPAHLQIGNMANNSANGVNAFDGSIRDVAIYDRVLTGEEIGRNYLSSETSSNVPVPDMLYYKFAESTETNPPVFITDSSLAGATTGTIFSASPTTLQWETNVPGIPGTALHFNGVSTHIDTSNSVAFDFTTNSFTVNLWARPLTANGCLMENGIPLLNGWDLSVGGSYEVRFNTESGGGEFTVSTGPGAANVGLFTMITIVRTSLTTLLIYINGNPVSTFGSIVSPASSNNSLMIGTDRAGAHFYDGDLSMPQIWGAALSPRAIANLYLIQSSRQPWP
jgi:Concanavalin A-like lectin/glucanases superfamily